jgi:hypothetical protein
LAGLERAGWVYYCYFLFFDAQFPDIELRFRTRRYYQIGVAKDEPLRQSFNFPPNPASPQPAYNMMTDNRIVVLFKEFAEQERY